MDARIASFGILAFLLPSAAPVFAQPDPCVSGAELLRAGLVEDAADQFAAAADADLPCGGGPDATAALEAKREAQARYREGQAAEARGDRASAVERYTAALEVNRQHEDAEGALRRLGGVPTTTTTTNPFAAAESLAGLGREDESTEAALKTITDTGTTPDPDSPVHDLVDRNWWERGSDWVLSVAGAEHRRAM